MHSEAYGALASVGATCSLAWVEGVISETHSEVLGCIQKHEAAAVAAALAVSSLGHLLIHGVVGMYASCTKLSQLLIGADGVEDDVSLA